MLKAIIRGHVQNVGFRRTTKLAADRKGFQGSVRNLPDGAVEILFVGERANLEQLLQDVKQLMPSNCMEDVAICEYTPSATFSPGFSILSHS